MGDDGELLRCPDDRFGGLVVAAFEAGHVPAAYVEPFTMLVQRMPVVLSSRTAGPLLTITYGFPESEIDLLRRGLIGAGFLDPAKARILLTLVLMSGADRNEIAHVFMTEGG
jgi:L-asparaginase